MTISTQTLYRDGCPILYELQGDGEKVILFLGGLLQPLWVSSEVRQPYSEAGYSILQIAFRGLHVGNRNAPVSIEAILQDVQYVLEHLGIKSLGVVGEALGGTLALALAGRMPQVIKCLALVGVLTGSDANLKQRLMAWRRELETQPFNDCIDKFFVAELLPSLREGRPELAAELRAAIVKDKTAEGLMALMDAAVAYRPSYDAREIDVPALIFSSQYDNLISPAHADRLASQLPNASLVEVPAGHVLTVEAMPEFVSLSLDWFARHLP